MVVAILAAIGMAGAAQAKDLLVLADDIPAGLDYDGSTASLIPTDGGIANLLEPLVYYAHGEVNEEGVQPLDFDKFEGRLGRILDLRSRDLRLDLQAAPGRQRVQRRHLQRRRRGLHLRPRQVGERGRGRRGRVYIGECPARCEGVIRDGRPP